MQRFNRGMQQQVYRFLVSWAEEVKAQAQKLVPVKTGYLRSSIYAKVQEWVATIGAEAAYGVFVEMGTRHMQAHPYLYPALQEHLPLLEKIILDALAAAKAEAGLP